MTPLEQLLLSLAVAIRATADQLKLSPEDMLQSIDRNRFTTHEYAEVYQKQTDVCIMVEGLQETLNNLLDARKKLILLGLYELRKDYEKEKGHSGEQEIQVGVREEISESLEEDEDSDIPTSNLPSNTKMEI